MTIYAWSYTDANSNANADAECPWQEGMAAKNVNNDARGTMLRVAQLLRDLGGAVSAGGTANGLTITAGSPFTTLADGRIVSFRATAANTGDTTLNVNGIGAKAIRVFSQGGERSLPAGAIQSGGIYIAQYSEAANSGSGGWVLINPSNFASLLVGGSAASPITATRNQTTNISYEARPSTGNPVRFGLGAANTFAVKAASNLDTDPWMAVTSTSATFAGSLAAQTAQIGGSGATAIVATRSDTTNVAYEARPSSGSSVFFGLGAAGTFAVRDSDALNLNPWMEVTSTEVKTRGSFVLLSSTSQFIARPTAGTDSIPFDYWGQFTGGGTVTAMRFRRGLPAGGTIGSISVTTTATAYNTSSDYRLKHDVEGFDGSGPLIDALRPVTFKWNVDDSSDVGFIAHEVQAVFPQAISGEKDGDEMQGGDWSKLVPILVAELKAVRARLAALESAA